MKCSYSISAISYFLLLFYSYTAHSKPSIEDILSQLTLDEKIGQLFMVSTVADPSFVQGTSLGIDPATYQRINRKHIEHLIKDYHIGGIIFQRLSTPLALVSAINHYQKINKTSNKIPLIIGQDLEWGLSMRLVDVVRFPRNMTLGALSDDKLIYEMGKEIARQCKLLGVHINFSPVVDINTNPANPIIGSRSFGQDKELVSQKGIAMMKGLQDGGIIACAKHFPGHGDTSKDSHLTLPQVVHGRDRLFSVELHPFRELIKSGVKAIMTAHLDVPALDPAHVPSSLSPAIVTQLLREQLKFPGLIITDGLDMHGVCQNKPAGSVELQALLAGNDILLCPKHVPEAVTCIKKAITDGRISEVELDNHVKRILQAKHDVIMNEGLLENVPSADHLSRTLNSKNAAVLKRSLYKKALTLVKNDKRLLPLRRGTAINYIQVGLNDSDFSKKLAASFQTVYHPPMELNNTEIDAVLKKINKDIPLVIALMGMNSLVYKDYGITEAVRKLVQELCAACKNSVLVLFGSPYALKWFEYVPAILVAYEDDKDVQEGVAEVIAGIYGPKGKLPITACPAFKGGMGLSY